MKPDDKRSVRARTTTCRREYKIVTNSLMSDPYWDECWGYHKSKGWRTHRYRKQILNYQVRMYKTWKHNRKTQWK